MASSFRVSLSALQFFLFSGTNFKQSMYCSTSRSSASNYPCFVCGLKLVGVGLS